MRTAQLLLVPLIVVLIAIVAVFYVMFGASEVVGPSMLPNLRSADGLLVTKGYTHPRRGDIVTIEIVGQDGQKDEVVKRVIALPGDVIEIRDDIAIVNGRREHGYAVLRDPPGHGDSRAPARIPAGRIYLMGDNRPLSYDSRYIGPQPLSKVSGRAVAVYMPITRVRLIEPIQVTP